MSLERISEGGRFGVLAADHRDSLRRVMDPADPDGVPAADIVAFKRDLVAGLADGATGVMLEPEYSIPQLVGALPAGVGFVAALEAQGYLADPEAGPVSILEGWSPAAAAASGAAAAKLFISYRPDRPHAAVQEAAAAEILSECRRAGLPLVLEPLFYGIGGRPVDPGEREGLVLETVRRFAPLAPDLLKLPFPAPAGDGADPGAGAWACREISRRWSGPWVLLSGGGAYPSFRGQLEVAMGEGCSGFMAGRALWTEAVEAAADQRPAVIAEVIAPRLAELRSLLG